MRMGASDEGGRQPYHDEQPSGLDQALQQGVTEIFRGLRLSRGFERQKLGRRQKQARADNDTADLARLDGEVVLLKNLDLMQTAEFHLYKTLLRIKSISSSPDFPSYVERKVEESMQPREATYYDVSARLFKTGPTVNAMEKTLQIIYHLMGIEDGPRRKKRLRKADFKSNRNSKVRKESHDQNVEASSRTKVQMAHKMAAISKHEKSSSPDHVPPAVVSESNEHVEPDLTERFTDDGRSSRSRTTSSDDENREQRRQESKTKRPAQPSVKATAFLPSLAAGYFSGSESDPSDIGDEEGSKPRKNRMGQRARQALWEKKFGSSANHVKKERKSRDYGWDARKGAQDDHGGKVRGTMNERKIMPTKGSNRQEGRPYATQKGPSNQKYKRSADTEDLGSLHPSWEAARKLKEQKAIPAFQGKKLVFD